jgi:hypothetical protein
MKFEERGGSDAEVHRDRRSDDEMRRNAPCPLGLLAMMSSASLPARSQTAGSMLPRGRLASIIIARQTIGASTIAEAPFG